jgi:predicted ferric reductase
MKNIKIVFWGLVLGLTALWLLADPVWWSAPAFLPLRNGLINATGILAMGVMAVALMLAARPAFVEPWLGGLDKMYRLHKWLGIAGLVMALSHWAWTKSPGWLLGLGLIEPPVRGPRVVPTEPVFLWLQQQRGWAEAVGEWAFYAGVLLIALALIKRFPYRWFIQTHKLLAVVYLVLVAHSVVLMNTGYWSQAVAPVLALLMLGGAVAALRILLGRVGIHRKALGVVDSLVRRPELGVLEIVVQLKGWWTPHQTGQFAFVTLVPGERPHPFTISSLWEGDGQLQFIVKALGDHTDQLAHRLKLGDPVEVEGPYGRFNFNGNRAHQIWVGGGIGITPFIARMKRLAAAPDGRSIDLFHTTREVDASALAQLKSDAEEANVALHVLVDARDGLLTAQRIRDAVPGWRTSDVWFCGPAAMGLALRKALKAGGMADSAFHQELFAMR